MIKFIVLIFIILFWVFLPRVLYENIIVGLENVFSKIGASVIVICMVMGLCYLIWW